MSTFQRAREALGLRLRELRRDARLTGRQLAELHGWHPSKVSKIEAGKQTPSDANIEAWTRVTGHTDQVGELIATLRTLEEHYVQFRRMFRTGMAAKQLEIQELEDEAEFLRNFEPTFIPGLLQTPEYARYRLAEAVAYDAAPDDLDESVHARMKRQQVLYRRRKRFHFVATEAALRYRLCPVEVMAGQLDRLATLTTLRNVHFGVIPFTAPYPVAPVHGFWVYDERVVFVENFTAELKLTQPSEIDSYLRVFGRLAQVAQYGTEARAVVTRVLDELTASER